jgi:hypothetical protein
MPTPAWLFEIRHPPDFGKHGDDALEHETADADRLDR